jgi:asparagine synthetase B (glutamine-hydrolysing)
LQVSFKTGSLLEMSFLLVGIWFQVMRLLSRPFFLKPAMWFGRCSGWDYQEQQLWAVRDRAGLWPVYWRNTNGIAAKIDIQPEVFADREPDPACLRQLLLLGLLPAPQTPWKNIRILAAGCLLRVDQLGSTELRWWSPGVNPTKGESPKIWAKSLGNACDLAIRNRLGEDPVAVAGEGLYAQAIIGKLKEKKQPFQQLVFGEEHPKIRVLPDRLPELLGVLGRMPWPLLSPGIPALIALSQAAQASGCSRLLTGYGGAQLFAEDRSHQLAKKAHMIRFLPEKLAARLGKDPNVVAVAKQPMARWLCGWRWRAPGATGVWDELDALGAACPVSEPLSALLWLERMLFLPQALMLVLHSLPKATGMPLEAPFLDASLQSLGATIPTDFLGRRSFSGESLKALVPPPWPEHRPLEVPIQHWLQGSMLKRLPERLEGWLAPAEVQDWIIRYEAGENLSQLLWGSLVLAAWR